MRFAIRSIPLAAALLLASGCATQSASYDYRRLAAGLGDYEPSIIDWNFPTSANQGPLEPPERLRPVPAAIGVPWGYGFWLWWQGRSPDPADAAPPPQTSSADEPDATCTGACAASPAHAEPDRVANARADARVREPSPAR